MRTLIRENLQTHHEKLVEKTMKKNRSFHKIMEESIGNGQIVSIKDQSGVEKRDQDIRQ